MIALISVVALAALFVGFGALYRRGEEAIGCGACGRREVSSCRSCSVQIDPTESPDANT